MLFEIKRKNKAFTLSEVLVSIALIGILSAILVPTILASRPKENMVMLKKAYFTLERAINKMINDDNLYPATQMGLLDGTTSVQRGFNYTTDPTGATTAATETKFCHYLAEALNAIGTVTCSGGPSSNGVGWGAGSFVTSDGIVWKIYMNANDATPNSQFPLTATAAAAYRTLIYVDVNGSKGPNCTAESTGRVASACAVTTSCASNPDYFSFGIRYDGKIDIGGYYNGTTKLTDTCQNTILSQPFVNR